MQLWRRVARNDGQAMVEFVLVLPFLLGFIFLMIQGGVAYHDKITMTDAVRVGARAAAVNRTTAGGPCAAATTAIQNTLSSSQWDVASTRIECNTPLGVTLGNPIEIKIVGYPFTIGIGALKTDGAFTVRAQERLE
jgi:Flp pilus assembly protein TadG